MMVTKVTREMTDILSSSSRHFEEEDLTHTTGFDFILLFHKDTNHIMEASLVPRSLKKNPKSEYVASREAKRRR